MSWQRRPRPLRPHAVSPRRHLRPQAAGLLTLGIWHNFGDDVPLERQRYLLHHRVRPRHHALRPREQLRPALRRLRAELRPRDGDRPGGAPRRDPRHRRRPAGTCGPAPTAWAAAASTCVASLDQSLARMGLDYVDIFYHHRPDPETPLEETMAALDHIVRSGTRPLRRRLELLGAADTRRAHAILASLGTPLTIHQPSYSMLNRWIETDGLLDTAGELGIGVIGFTALAQGLLTGKYLDGVPADSRAGRGGARKPLDPHVSPEATRRIRGLARHRRGARPDARAARARVGAARRARHVAARSAPRASSSSSRTSAR